MIRYWLGILSVSGILLGQSPYQDARALGLAGATTSIAEGIHSVGYNPANLALSPHDFSMNVGGLTYVLENNTLSVENYNLFNGARFEAEDSTHSDYVNKDEFLNRIPDEGLALTTIMHLPMPGINWTRGITAFSSEMVTYGTVGLPKGFFNLFFEGNIVGDSLTLNLNEELLTAIEWGFSIATPLEGAAFGITLKYLQGLFYIGVDEDSSYGYFMTDTTGFRGAGQYLIKQAIGGSGFAVDLGFATREVNGYRLGISLINAWGRIRWLGPSLTKELFGTTLQGLMPWRENEYYLYTFRARDVTAFKYMQDEPLDSLFENESYTVIETASGLVRSDTLVAEDLAEVNPKAFVTNYPTFFRLGVSKEIEEFGLITMDLVAGFQDDLWSKRGWEMALGMEILSTPTFPFRMGIRFGGRAESQLGLGFGVHKGPLQFDMALALHNGIWLHTTKGFSLAMGLTLVR